MTKSWHIETFDDLEDAVSNKTPESLILEYKGSKVLTKSDTGKIGKTVTAFANSVGGQFVLGVEVSSNHEPEKLDGGHVGKSKMDWIHQIISSHTFPPVTNVNIKEFQKDGGRYYVLNIPRSLSAPHQASDNVYYRRRGSLSVPMDHYELEDIRNRPKEPSAPLKVSLATHAGFGFIKFENSNSADPILNVKCQIESNVELEPEPTAFLTNSGIQSVQPLQAFHFPIGHIDEMLQCNSNAEISLSFDYGFRSSLISDHITFHLSSLSHSIVWQDPIPMALERVAKQLSKIDDNLGKIAERLARLQSVADGSGLRLSQTTLQSLKNEFVHLDPKDYDIAGYKIIANLNDHEAKQLWLVFHTFQTHSTAEQRYRALPDDLKKRFEQKFSVSF